LEKLGWRFEERSSTAKKKIAKTGIRAVRLTGEKPRDHGKHRVRSPKSYRDRQIVWGLYPKEEGERKRNSNLGEIN